MRQGLRNRHSRGGQGAERRVLSLRKPRPSLPLGGLVNYCKVLPQHKSLCGPAWDLAFLRAEALLGGCGTGNSSHRGAVLPGFDAERQSPRVLKLRSISREKFVLW